MENKKTAFNLFLERIRKIKDSSLERDEKLQDISKLLKDNLPYYNWVGFYFASPGKKELFLGPFEGEATEHREIPFGKGICGQAAEKKKTLLIQDVSQERNYLSCSEAVKAEIVVPIFKNKKLVGEIDIDSHQLSPFSQEDKKFLEEVSRIIAELF